MKRLIPLVIGLLLFGDLSAFCGFYVAKADATLFNHRSQVILVRDGLRTVVTMSNDFKGDVKDFAMVVPVPSILRERDIRVVNPSLFSKLDNYSAPRMAEYYDQQPCEVVYELEEDAMLMESVVTLNEVARTDMRRSAKKYKVTIEAQYDIEEYDVLILSAKESTGLKRWLTENGYKIPEGAEEVLDPYIKNGLKFFVVKVDLDKVPPGTTDYLRPLQIEYYSSRFMLPIRLGMANADGEQDMLVYAFTRQGRVECTNYRTVKLPTDREIPSFVKTEGRFGEFYKDLYAKSHDREGRNAVFLEYAWDVTPNFGVKCDPCVGPPPMFQEFVDAGANWLNANNPQPGGIFFTRLHVRYSRDEFPQDLQFQVTPNKERFQGRYVIHNAAVGDMSCSAGQQYLEDLENRRRREVDELQALAGWNDPRHAGYIYQYSSQIYKQTEEERNGLLPIISPSNKTGWPKLLALAGFVLTCVFWIRRSRRAKTSTS